MAVRQRVPWSFEERILNIASAQSDAVNAVLSKVASGIEFAKIQNVEITNAMIQDLAVTNAKIADATIQSAKIASLAADKITAGNLSVTVTLTSTGTFQTATTGDRIVIEAANPEDLHIKSGTVTRATLGYDVGVPGVVLRSVAVPLYIQAQNSANLYMQSIGGNVVVSSDGSITLDASSYIYLDAFENARFNFGSVSEPSITFAGDIDTGIYHPNADGIGLVSGGTEVLRIKSNGPSVGVVDGTVSIPAINFLSDQDTGIYSPTLAQIALSCAGTQEFLIGSSGVIIPNVDSSTSGNSANVYVATGGQLYRSTSSERYKQNIMPWLGNDSVLKLTPVTFDGMIGTPSVDEEGKPIFEQGKRKQINLRPSGETLLGLTAEDVAANFPWAAIYDEEGRPDAINWNAIIAGLIAEVKRLGGRLEALDASKP